MEFPTILSWNCRGIASPFTTKALKHHIWRACPDVIFLSETKNSDELVDSKRRYLGYPEAEDVSPNGRSGGLALWWKHKVLISIIAKHQNYIHVKFGDQKPCIITFIYGHPRLEYWREVWDKIALLKPLDHVLWFCIGDLNDVIHPSEVKGHRSSSTLYASALNDFCVSHHIVDLGYVGPPFTWTNKQTGDMHQKKWLDRVVASITALSNHPNAIVEHYQLFGSDHRPILLSLGGKRRRNHRGFRFKDKWVEMCGFNQYWMRAGRDVHCQKNKYSLGRGWWTCRGALRIGLEAVPQIATVVYKVIWTNFKCCKVVRLMTIPD